jgi:DNA primase
MAGRIPQTFIDDLLARVNIVDVVDSRIRLKKAGKNHSACCPFHNEKTPSFTVASDKQFYYCFGCGAKGNAIGFVMDYDNIEFPEAVTLLADSMGMEVPKEEMSPFQQKQQQERVSHYELMGSANEFYQQQLRFHDGKQVAIDYLKNRGLSGKAAKFFNIGYAPPGWSNLKDTLGVDPQNKPDDEKHQALIDTGMLVEKDSGKTYDRFRNRIVFPIRDVRGRTIGFGARTLGDDKPKYLNSPETTIFNKGQELYGLYECRQIRQPLKRFLVVEGYMDVVALHEFGLHYAVATLGTATSPTHLQKMFKIAPEVIFCFDGDQAGLKAAKRGLEQSLPILEDGQQIRFLFLPDGEDPDSMVRKEGKEGFEQRINNAQGIGEYLIRQLQDEIEDPEGIEGRARLAKLAGPMIMQIPGIALKSLFWQKLAETTHIDVSDLKAMAEAEPKPAYEASPTNTAKSSSPNANQANRHDPSSIMQSTAAVRNSESIPSHHEDSDYSDYENDGAYQGEDNYQDHNGYHHNEHEQSNEHRVVETKEPAIVSQTISILLHAPQVIQRYGDLAFLQEFKGHYSTLLTHMIEKLQASPQNNLLDALGILTNDPDYQSYRELSQQHNKKEGHLEQEQAANDCLNNLRIRAAKQIQSRILKQLGNKHSFNSLSSQDQQLFSWAKRLTELDLLNTKLLNCGGKLQDLSEGDQKRYQELMT